VDIKFNRSENLPIPAGPRAPITPIWYFRIAPFAAVIAAYRLIPAWRRSNWNAGNRHTSTSHVAMAEVLKPIDQGGGWAAFRHYTTPRFARRRQPRSYALAWALLTLSVARYGVQHDHGVSWAN